MDDSLAVGTDHIEKITRTSSVPQFSFENSINPLDQTELYDVDLPDQSKVNDITFDDSMHVSCVSECSELPMLVEGIQSELSAGVTVNNDIDRDITHNPDLNSKEDSKFASSQRQVNGDSSGAMCDALSGNGALDDNANPKRSSQSENVSGSCQSVTIEPILETSYGGKKVDAIVEDLTAVSSGLHDQVKTAQDNVHSSGDIEVSLEGGKCLSDSSDEVARQSPGIINEVLSNGDAQLLPVNYNDEQLPLTHLSNESSEGLIEAEPNSVEKLFTDSEPANVLTESLVSTVDEIEPVADCSVVDNSEGMLAPEETSPDDTKMQSLEQLCNSLKEPEECDHGQRCSLETNEQPLKLEETRTVTDTKEETWSQLLGNDKLKKLVIRNGEREGRQPCNGQLVTVRCIGQLADGTTVDQHDSLPLILGDGDFIEAFDVCIGRMRVGEVCQLVTDAQYAYGTRGREPDIPKNASLTYEIELKNVEDVPAFFNLPISVRIQLSNLKRERGNVFYLRNESNHAIQIYLKALKIVDDSSESHAEDFSELQMLLDARVKCHNNLAAALLKVESWDAALQSINHVLRVQPDNVKALFRKGKCLTSKGEHEAAIPYLQKAAKLEPETKIIQQELSRLEKWNAEQKKSQKAMYKKMLGGDKKRVQAKKESSSSTWLWYGAAATAIAVVASVAMYRRFGHS